MGSALARTRRRKRKGPAVRQPSRQLNTLSKEVKEVLDAGRSEAAYLAEKQKQFGKDYPGLKWRSGKLGGATATAFVQSLPQDGSVFQGRLAEYAKHIGKINVDGKGNLHADQWMAYPVGWKDPNIGDLATENAALKKDPALVNKITATIFGEQNKDNLAAIAATKSPQAKAEEEETGRGLDQQRAYIWHSMQSRVVSASHPATLEKNVTGGQYHAIKERNQGFVQAEAHLAGKKVKGLNTAAVDAVQDLVSGGGTTIPADAGRYYFHWNPGTLTAQRTFNATLKSELAKGTPDAAARAAAEKAGALAQATDVLKVSPDAAALKTGWNKKIPGPNRGKANERIGSMYIYK